MSTRGMQFCWQDLYCRTVIQDLEGKSEAESGPKRKKQ